jgi:hypothetical protein
MVQTGTWWISVGGLQADVGLALHAFGCIGRKAVPALKDLLRLML